MPLSRKRIRPITQRYLSYDLRGKTIHLPLINIRLINPDTNASLKTYALIDSGATVTFVDTEIAEILELRHTGESTADGAGGSFENWDGLVDIELLKGSNVICVLKDIDACIPKKLGQIPYCVLGRDSIFREYDITFRENQEKTILRNAKKSERV